MINIAFKNGQGLGNQLWMFAVAKSISEELGVKLNIYEFSKFKGKSFLILDNENNHEYGIQEYNHPKKIETFHERIFYDHDLKYSSSDFDERVLKINKPTLLEGIFQSENYFFGDLAKLKRYIKLKKSFKKNNEIDKDICLLNIRGGEYKRHKNFILPLNYWLNAMENYRKRFKIKKFKIVTDDYRYAKKIFPELEIIHGDIGKCYASLYNAKNVIVSNSSFSYFPCKTGIKKKVIAPVYWARPNNKLNRWASPCNLYKNWLWQDTKSSLMTYQECLKITEESREYYKEEFTILINRKNVPKNKILYLIPNKLKIVIKKILGYFLPRHFG